jgi:Outer membrane lipoprotein-sorting protein
VPLRMAATHLSAAALLGSARAGKDGGRGNDMERPTWVLVFALVLAANARAAGAETARQILDRQRALEDGSRRWTDRHERLRMDVLAGRRAPRQMAVDLFDKKYRGREQRTMAYFSAPDTVKGTAFLAVTHPDRSGQQWLYLPEARRARRIGGAVRQQGFVGTDLTYHDLDLLAQLPSWSESDAASHLRGAASIDGVRCHVIELTPQREDIGYRRIVVWLGVDDLVARQVELYGAAPSAGWLDFGATAASLPTRRVRQSEVRMVGSIPVPHRAEVESPGAGSTTTVIFTHVAFDQGLPDELFTQPAMEWGRYQPTIRDGSHRPQP